MADSDGRIRLGHFSKFSPIKLGTGEARIVAFARACQERNHRYVLFGYEPIHADVRAALKDAGAEWRSLADIERAPVRAAAELGRNFDVLQLNMIPPRGRAALAAYLAWPAKVLFVDRVSGPIDEPGPNSFASRMLDRVTMTRVHQMAGITEYVRERTARRFSLPPERTCTIYNGVDCERFHPPSRREAHGGIRILSVGTLIREKGMDVLIRAVAGLDRRDCTLTIAGEGPEREPLLKLAAELGIAGQVQLVGLRNDVDVLMREADVFAHPAVWQEALGNTVLEGMASGCCVVASKVGGIPELIRHSVDGLLVPPADVSEWIKALNLALQSPDERSRMAASARQRVERSFSLDASIAQHIDWCERAARGSYFTNAA